MIIGRSWKRTAAVLLLAISVVACTDAGGDVDADATGADAVEGDRLQIATTVAPITSLVASIAGDRAVITGIVPEGVNSHTFEPAPSVAALLSVADLFIMNGLQLEEPTRELAEVNLRDGVQTVSLGDEAITREEWIFDFSFPEAEGKPNPHLWTDPNLVIQYANVIADALTELDPAGATIYADNLGRLLFEVDAFDTALTSALSTVEPEHRRLLTYHDSFAYFARSYAWTVTGAIQVADFGEPTPKEVAALITQVRDSGVPAIFGSEVFPSPVLEQIGEEAGVRYVDVLRDDDLPGEPGDPDHSLLGLLRFDFVTIVEALGGDATALEEFEIVETVPDEAEYPQ